MNKEIDGIAILKICDEIEDIIYRVYNTDKPMEFFHQDSILTRLKRIEDIIIGSHPEKKESSGKNCTQCFRFHIMNGENYCSGFGKIGDKLKPCSSFIARDRNESD